MRCLDPNSPDRYDHSRPAARVRVEARATARIMMALGLLATLACSSLAGAQAATPAAVALPSVKQLKAAREADSLKKLAMRQDAQVARLQRANQEQAAMLREQQAALGAMQRRLDSLARQVGRGPASAADAAPAVAAGAPAASRGVIQGTPASAAPATVVATTAPATPAAVPAASAAPAAAPPATPQPAAAPAAPAATAAKPPAAPVKSLEAGFGRIVFNGLLQGWMTAGDAGYRSTFRVRRTELKFTGEVTPKAKWTLLVDPSKSLSLTSSSTTTPEGTKVLTDASVNQSGRMLQDAFISLEYLRGMRIDVGQQKVPLSLEGLQSSAALETIERAMFASDRGRGGSFGDIRDIGASVRGTIASRLDYHAGVYNGSGETMNETDRNDAKSLGARLAFRPPLLTGLQVGGSGIWGGAPRADSPRRDRLGAEVLYRFRTMHVKSELMTGKDGAVSRRGFYAQAGMRANPLVELVTRFDSWDPDIDQESSAATAMARDYVGGVNVFLQGVNVKLQANYVHRTTSNDVIPARNIVTANVQASW